MAAAGFASGVRCIFMAGSIALVDVVHISRLDASAVDNIREMELGIGQEGYGGRGRDCNYHSG